LYCILIHTQSDTQLYTHTWVDFSKHTYGNYLEKGVSFAMGRADNKVKQTDAARPKMSQITKHN